MAVAWEAAAEWRRGAPWGCKALWEEHTQAVDWCCSFSESVVTCCCRTCRTCPPPNLLSVYTAVKKWAHVSTRWGRT